MALTINYLVRDPLPTKRPEVAAEYDRRRGTVSLSLTAIFEEVRRVFAEWPADDGTGYEHDLVEEIVAADVHETLHHALAGERLPIDMEHAAIRAVGC